MIELQDRLVPDSAARDLEIKQRNGNASPHCFPCGACIPEARVRTNYVS